MPARPNRSAASSAARASLLQAAAVAMLAALAFWAFFQASKSPVFRGANPFAEDPADAVSSIGFEIALVAGLLSLARAVRLRELGAFDDHRPELVIRGGLIVLLTVFAGVAADTITEFQRPGWNVSIWGKVLIAGLAGLALLAIVTAALLVRATRRIWVLPATSGARGSGWLGEAMEDVFLLGWLPAAWAGQRLPPLGGLLRWLAGLWRGAFALRLRAALGWLSPWTHPWRFALLAGLVAGLALAAAHAREGPPDDLGQFVVVSLVFVGIEFAATLAGFVILGGFLGLRPPLRAGRRSG